MMRTIMRSLPRDSDYRRDLVTVYAILAVMNVGAWLWALIAFAGRPVQLGVAVVVYGLGLRHAVDADHIAAIDNVTRKLLQQGRRSASIGFWFALGHSSIVFLATAAAVVAAGQFSRVGPFQTIGGLVSSSVSGLFLFFVAAMNACILLAIIRAIRKTRAGIAVESAELDRLFSGNGILARIFRPLFQRVSKPWHMGLLGFLFGLSFDTATEVSLFSIAATQAAEGAALSSALVYPALFAAGMSLIDTTDGVMMVGAYEWAVEDPLRKLYYNMTITFISIAVALLIGAVELSNAVSRGLGLDGRVAVWTAILGDKLDYLGIGIIAASALAWFISVVAFRVRPREHCGRIGAL